MNALERDEQLARDPLAVRLARIDVASPPELARRVLAREHVRGRRRRWHGRTLVLVAAGLAAATVVTAMTTGVRSYVGELASDMGLAGSAHDLAAVSGEGQRIRVTSGVDDGWIVILDLRAEPGVLNHEPSPQWVIGKLTATDANGAPLQAMGWQGNAADGGDEALALFRRPAGGAPPGSPITLHDQPLLESPSRDLTPAPGPGWTLRFRVPASRAPAHERVPAAGRVDGVDVRFVDVRASARYIVVVLDATGPDQTALFAATVGSLTDPSGGRVSNMPGPELGTVPVAGGVTSRVELYWPRQGSGTYRLTLGTGSGPYLVRDLVIR